MAKLALEFTSPPSSPQKLAKPEELLSPTTIASPSNNATIHGMLASLSPIKPTRYFDGELTDGNAVIRVVGFDKAQQQHLLTYCEQEVPITLSNCQVQYNRSKSKLEVVLKRYTKIQRSPVQFDIQDLKTVGSPLFHSLI